MTEERTAQTATTTGPMTGLSHVQLRVTDVTTSAAWYAAALGLLPFRADPAIGYVALRHQTSGVVIVLTKDTTHDWQSESGPLDHLAFAVPDGATLEVWADHLTSVGIDHEGVVPEGGNPSLQLRDPDGTSIELVAPRSRHS